MTLRVLKVWIPLYDDLICSDRILYFSTQIAISEQGQILAKYRKTHLYRAADLFAAGSGAPVFFDTSFGVRFGMLVCFDLLFPEPQSALLSMGIKDFVVSSWWVNLDIFQSSAVQQATSSALESNLLAAGIGFNFFSSGSGLYSNGTVLESFHLAYKEKRKSELLVAEVPILKKIKRSSFMQTTVLSNRNSASNQNETFFLPKVGNKQTLSIDCANFTCIAEFESIQVLDNSPFVLKCLDGQFDQIPKLSMCSLSRVSSIEQKSFTTFSSINMFIGRSSQPQSRNRILQLSIFNDGAVSNDLTLPLVSRGVVELDWSSSYLTPFDNFDQALVIQRSRFQSRFTTSFATREPWEDDEYPWNSIWLQIIPPVSGNLEVVALFFTSHSEGKILLTSGKAEKPLIVDHSFFQPKISYPVEVGKSYFLCMGTSANPLDGGLGTVIDVDIKVSSIPPSSGPFNSTIPPLSPSFTNTPSSREDKPWQDQKLAVILSLGLSSLGMLFAVLIYIRQRRRALQALLN